MIVQAFIPDWPGEKQHAQANADIIEKFCPVTILDNPDDYFNAQWEKARSLFTGDILLWCMADVQPPDDFAGMYAEAIRLLRQGDVGWYAPDIDWTGYIYDKADLKLYMPSLGCCDANEMTDWTYGLHPAWRGVYEVPNTDSLCFFIRGDVVWQMPFIDPELSFMWGMDYTAIATARLMHLKCVRDYRFKAFHPNDTGYDIPRASQSMRPLYAGFSDDLQKEIGYLMRETERLRRRPLPIITRTEGLTELERNQMKSAELYRRGQR